MEGIPKHLTKNPLVAALKSNKLPYLIGLIILAAIQSCRQGESAYTYRKDIAPLIYDHCYPCHRDGGTAPFPLSNYREVYRKKKTIVRVTQSGYMPPWPADPEYSHFVGERYLSAEEREMIRHWAENGAAEGSGEEPALPELSLLSKLGKPDLTLWLDSIYIAGNNRDRFFVVKVPYELAHDTFVKAVEFVAGEHQIVHHMNGHLLQYEEGMKADVFEGERIIDLEAPNYVENFNRLKLYNDDGSKPQRTHSAVNYLPGVEGTRYPEGIGGFRIKRKGAFVANDIHYGPLPEGRWDRSHINLFFTDRAPERPTFETMMGTNGVTEIVPPLIIPPGEIKTFRTEAIVPEDISILTINPHMHLLGKRFLAYGISPTGDTIRLIHIPKWDFRWQYFYTFQKMLKVPRGTRLVVEATFDNTLQNPNNPYNPPRTIGERLEFGGSSMRTTDEMLQFIITWLPYQEGDELISLEP